LKVFLRGLGEEDRIWSQNKEEAKK